MLDGYESGDIKIITVDGKQYQIVYYQGSHSNEYLICEMINGTKNGYCQLFDRGILSLSWIIQDDQRVYGLTVYSHGKAMHKQNWGSLLGKDDIRLIKNTPYRLTMTVQSQDNKNNNKGNMSGYNGGGFGTNVNQLSTNSRMNGGSLFGGYTFGATSSPPEMFLYRGEFDSEMNRHGYGIEYDRHTGKEKIMGYWNKDKLIRIIREFDADNKQMIEYKESNNLELLSRVPIYIGGYCFLNGSYLRNGKGYLIGKVSGTAIREGVWENGKERSGTDLYDGWYVEGMRESIRFILKRFLASSPKNAQNAELQITVKESNELENLNRNVTKLIVSPNSCNTMAHAIFVDLKCLQTIEIGDNCFVSVKAFGIVGLDKLQTLKIGNYDAFNKNNTGGKLSSEDIVRSFHILNCEELKSIDIGKYSFGVFGGEFELKNLPSLESIKIGITGDSESTYNFFYSSFIIRGIPIDSNIYFYRSAQSKYYLIR